MRKPSANVLRTRFREIFESTRKRPTSEAVLVIRATRRALRAERNERSRDCGRDVASNRKYSIFIIPSYGDGSHKRHVNKTIIQSVRKIEYDTRNMYDRCSSRRNWCKSKTVFCLVSASNLFCVYTHFFYIVFVVMKFTDFKVLFYCCFTRAHFIPTL